MKLKLLLKNKIIKQLLIFILFTFISFYCVRFYANPYFIGEENVFSWNRLLSVGGYFKSPINFQYLWHSGSGANIMHPSITIYLFALIAHFTHNFFTSIKLFMFVIFIVSLYCSYFLGKRVSKSKLLGIVFAVSYMLSTYSFTLFYSRFAIGEFISYGVLPLVILGLFEIVSNNFKRWWILSIGLTLIAYSNFNCLWLTLIVVIILVIIAAFMRKLNISHVKYLVIAFTTALLLSLVVLVPMFELVHSNLILGENGTTKQFSDQSVSMGRLLTLALNNETWVNSDFHQFDFMNRVEVYAFGIGPIIAIIISMFNFKNNNWGFNSFLILAIIFIIMRSTYFPWFTIQQFRPVLFFVQLYKLNMFITIFAYLSMLKYLSTLSFNWKISITVGTTIVSLVLFTSLFYSLSSQRYYLTKVSNANVNKYGTNVNSEDSYLLKYSNEQILDKLKTDANFFDKYLNTAKKYDFVNSSRAYIKETSKANLQAGFISNNAVKFYTYKNTHYNYYLDNKKLDKSNLDIKYDGPNYLLNFKNKKNKVATLVIPVTVNVGTRVYVNGKESKYSISDKYGSLQLNLDPKSTNSIRVTYEWTKLSRISQISSLICWILLIAYIFISEFIGFKKSRLTN